MLKKACPELVASESSHRRILKRHGNAKAAADGILAYWQMRFDFFGDKRAFKAMNLSREGAFDDAAIEYLSEGGVVLLPRDEQGGDVLCADHTRGMKIKAAPEVRKRAAFFLIQSVFNRKGPSPHSRD